MSNNPYTHQEAGTHYVNMGMQPFHFAMVNGWDAGAFSILKYISRHRTKNGLEDLKKARHFVDLRQAEITATLEPRIVIRMGVYIRENKLVGRDATALMHLQDWVSMPKDHPDTDAWRKILNGQLYLLMDEYCPTPLP